MRLIKTRKLHSGLLSSIARLLLGVCALGSLAWSAHGGEIQVRWNASTSTGVAGYQVLWGLSSGNYNRTGDASNATSYTVTGLTEGSRYYFTVKAYNASRTIESGFSNEVNGVVPTTAAPPNATFSGNPRTGEAPLTVTFNDTSTGAVDSRSWNFDVDGTSGTSSTGYGATAMHTYSDPGTYKVSLTVEGPGGEDTVSRANYIDVQAPTSSGGGSGGSGSGGDGSGSSGGGSGANGLVLALGFEEQDDVLIRDASGSGNDGIADGPSSIGNGKYGRALKFDGVNDWVTVNDAQTLDLGDGMTLEAWVYPTETPAGYQPVIIKEQPNGLVYILNANTDQNQPSTSVHTGGYGSLFGGTRLQANEWTHLATTYDGSQQRLFVNGTQVASRAQSGTMTNGSGVLHIGGNDIWGPSFFKGRIDEVRIYNRKLSGQEIRADMETPVVASSGGGGSGSSGGGSAASYQQTGGADGLVSIELETYDAKVPQNAHDWTTVNRSGASGGKAVEATPNTGFNVNTGYVELSPRMDYTVEFVKTGTHYVWVRGLASSNANNSLHVGLDGSPVSTADRMNFSSGSWTWSKDTMDGVVATINVPSTGVHTLNVWMREDGMVADQLVLTTNSGYDPAGSAQSGESTGGGGGSTEGGGSSSPVLSGQVSAGPASADLTALGSIDWIHVGRSSASDVNRKAGVSARIGAPTILGTATRFVSGTRTQYRWSDGSPRTNEGGTGAFLYNSRRNEGFELNVEADTSVRTLRLYVGGWRARGRLVASLSADNGNAPPPYTVDLENLNGDFDRVVELQFASSSSGQTLSIRYTETAGSNITFAGAALE